jgi:hypothetical protein
MGSIHKANKDDTTPGRGLRKQNLAWPVISDRSPILLLETSGSSKSAGDVLRGWKERYMPRNPSTETLTLRWLVEWRRANEESEVPGQLRLDNDTRHPDNLSLPFEYGQVVGVRQPCPAQGLADFEPGPAVAQDDSIARTAGAKPAFRQGSWRLMAYRGLEPDAKGGSFDRTGNGQPVFGGWIARSVCCIALPPCTEQA